ncbi:MAG: hypothetical protein LUI60_04620 [Clostridia bacterium]|nr:hypothetical protein [Clostridia bacterium]
MRFFRALKLWRKYHKDWESICNCCGKCCYSRSVGRDGSVIIYYNRPCENLDTKTHLCSVYQDRFKKCNHCGKVNLFTALYNPTLPKDCPYVQIFRYGKEIEVQDEK